MSRDLTGDRPNRRSSRVTLPSIRDILADELARSPNHPVSQLPLMTSAHVTNASPPLSLSGLQRVLPEELVTSEMAGPLSQSNFRRTAQGGPHYPSDDPLITTLPHSFLASPLTISRSRSSSYPAFHARTLSSPSESERRSYHQTHQRLSVPSSRSTSPYARRRTSPTSSYHSVQHANSLQFSPGTESGTAQQYAYVQMANIGQSYHHQVLGSRHGSTSDHVYQAEMDARMADTTVESSKSVGKYECSYCGKRFNRPSSLRIHTNTHTGEKPFQCPEPGCGRSFSVQSNMRRHARVHITVSRQQKGGSESDTNESVAITPPSYSPPTPSMHANPRPSIDLPLLAHTSVSTPRRARSGQPVISASFSQSHTRSMSSQEMTRRRGSISTASSSNHSRSTSPEPEDKDKGRLGQRSRNWKPRDSL